MNEKNRRHVTGLIVLFLASCGPIQSGQVADQINAMVGLSQEHVLSCMGPPTSTAHVGATEVWSYNVGGPVTTSAVMGGNQSLVAGSATTSQEFCVLGERRPRVAPDVGEGHAPLVGGSPGEWANVLTKLNASLQCIALAQG